jgi:DNA-binding NarL/FixJ family response regulator
LIRVLIVDDHSLVLDGISSLLEAAGYDVVGQASDGKAALALALQLRPDIVLLDINMPGMGGIEVLRLIKEVAPDMKVAMLTASEREEDLLAALQAGASGYILKSAKADELLTSLVALEKGEMALGPQMASLAVKGLVKVVEQQDAASETVSLTARETEILKLVSEGLSNRAIGRRLEISENTIKYHLKKILQKLGAQNRTEAVAYALRFGLLGGGR